MKKKHVHAEFISLNISLSNKKTLPKTGSTNKSIFIISSSLGGREALSISFFTKKVSATLKSKETSDPLIFKY